MAHLYLDELLRFLQNDPSKFSIPIVFGETDPKITEMIKTLFSAYQGKIHCLNPYLDKPCTSKNITLQKSLEARFSFPALSVGIIGTIGLNFNNHSSVTEGWPGNSTAQVVATFAGKLHLLAELHGTKEVYYYSNYAIRWGIESYQVIYIESVIKGTLIAPIEGKESKETEELISYQFVPEGQDKTLYQMTADDKLLYHPRIKALYEVKRVLENNGLVRNEE